MRGSRGSARHPVRPETSTARPGNSDGSTGKRGRRLAAALLLAVLVALAAGCTGSGTGSDSAGTSAPEAASDQDAGRGDARLDDGSGSGGEAASDGAPDGVNRTIVATREVIRTGQVALTDKDLEQIRDEVDQLLFTLDGSIDREETSRDDDGRIERSVLVLRVPVAEFRTAMEALEALGKVKTSDSASKDVTAEVIDVNERVETLQTSLDRLQRFQSQSENIDDLIRFEDQITERESELRSLEAQQAHLLDQTAMSTITLYLSTPDEYVPPPDGLDDAGFLAGLERGWNALKDLVVVGLTVLGAALPFAVTLALVGVPTWLLVRAAARRRTEAAGSPDTEGAPLGESP